MKVLKTKEGHRIEDDNGIFIMLLDDETFELINSVNTKLMQDRFNDYIEKHNIKID